MLGKWRRGVVQRKQWWNIETGQRQYRLNWLKAGCYGAAGAGWALDGRCVAANSTTSSVQAFRFGPGPISAPWFSAGIRWASSKSGQTVDTRSTVDDSRRCKCSDQLSLSSVHCSPVIHGLREDCSCKSVDGPWPLPWAACALNPVGRQHLTAIHLPLPVQI